jgi:hypothetical protein
VNGLTPIDAGVAYEAMIDMRDAARKYEAKRPGCVQAKTFTRKKALGCEPGDLLERDTKRRSK